MSSGETGLAQARRMHANALFLQSDIVSSTNNLLEVAENIGGADTVETETRKIGDTVDIRDLLIQAYDVPSQE